MSTNETIEVKPVTPRIGAEVFGVDLGQPLGNRTFQEIHDALMQHQVLFFRDQEMDLDRHKAFGRLFGDLHVHPGSPGPEGHPEVLVIHADATSKHVAGEKWHSDVSCDERPPMGSILHIHTLPEFGGDTLFSSMYTAYDALSEPMKRFLEGLTAVHDGEPVYRGRYTHQVGNDAGKVYPNAVHPVIRTHPVTRRKGIFVNSFFTTRIVELSREESDAVLEMLWDHVANPMFQCRFRWRKNSVAFWDNRCVQHQALWDYFPQVRSGFRVTIQGDKPF